MIAIDTLDDEEKMIIKKHRFIKEKNNFRYAQRIRALEIAIKYDRWLRLNNRLTSFSTFTDEFGYSGEDSSLIYSVVIDVIKAADQWGVK